MEGLLVAVPDPANGALSDVPPVVLEALFPISEIVLPYPWTLRIVLLLPNWCTKLASVMATLTKAFPVGRLRIIVALFEFTEQE